MASYQWNTGATTRCISVSVPSTYSVIVTDVNGCSSSCDKTVTLNPPPTCNITGNTNICGGGTTSLCATAGMASYSWSTGSTQQCITVNAAGNYTVTITNSAGCTSSCTQAVTSTNCGISLTKTPSVCVVGQGTVTPVLFTYVVTNNSSSDPASGTIIDDNGTPGNTSDDVNVCSWGPIAPGATATCTHTFNISNNYTNTAVANGVVANATVTATATASVNAVSCLCNLQYPDNSNLPRSAVVFNESEVLRASDPGPMTCGTTGSVIKLWYNDEHALTLGVRQVQVKTSSGTITTNYPITPGSTPSCVSNPLVGTTIATGNQSGNDEAAGGGRPLWPALFITDLTTNGPTSRIGDWQQGGTGITPSRVCGVWKGAVRIVDQTHSPAVVSITPDADPAKNHWNIAGGDVPPGGFAAYTDQGYGAEVSWNVNDLGLLPGHTYRLQFMVHDGDQNKSGGDVGETCTTIQIPASNCVSLVNVGNLVWSDANSNGLKDPAEMGIPGLTVKLYNDANNNDVPDGSAIATTTTDGNGIYNFGFLNPGNYIVGVVLPPNATVVPINGGDPDNDIDNDNNALNLVGNEVRSDAVTLNTGVEPTNDGDGNNGNLAVDFAIHTSTNILQKCYVGVSHHYVTATQSWTINTTTNTATIRTTFSKNFVDNTYGTNQIGWPNGHSFGNLTGSDKLTLQLYDVNHVKRMEFTIDYMSASNTFPSGYGSLGVTGGDGSMTLGNASDVLSYETSLDRNFNDYGYVLTTNSPATTANYTPNPAYPNWIYDVWYEVTVNLNAFPGGFGEPVVSGIHASPSKTGSNTELLNDTICVQAIPRLAENVSPNSYSEENLFVNAYPNPFKGSTTIEFQRSDKTSHVKIEVFTLSGRKVIDLFNQDAEAGVIYKTEFNAEGLPDGIYIYRMSTDDKVINGKLILMK